MILKPQIQMYQELLNAKLDNLPDLDKLRNKKIFFLQHKLKNAQYQVQNL